MVIRLLCCFCFLSSLVFSVAVVVAAAFVSASTSLSVIVVSKMLLLLFCSDGVLNRGIYIENNFDFGGSENHNDIDLFMRFNTNIKNGGKERDSTVFYTDMNGLQMQKRTLVRKLKAEANYYPITTATHIEDEESRLSLLVDHAMGAISWQRGQLEVMVDRRSTFDDARGMGEGVLDNRMTKHKYWLLYEPKRESKQDRDRLVLPSQVSSTLSRRLNSPPVHYVGQSPGDFGGERSLLTPSSSKALPCHLHLLNLRTLSDPAHPDDVPARRALIILQSQGADCALNAAPACGATARGANQTSSSASSSSTATLSMSDLKVKKAVRTVLTGVSDSRNGHVKPDLSDLNVDPMTLASARLHFN